MRFLVVSLALCLAGCATNQADFSLRHRELYVSPNGAHRIELDKDLYTFKMYFDSRMNRIPPSRMGGRVDSNAEQDYK